MTNETAAFDVRRLFDGGERLFGFYGLTDGSLYLFQRSRCGRNDGNFHFHRFHDDNDFILVDVIAGFFFDFQNFSDHRCFNDCGQRDSPFFDLCEPSFGYDFEPIVGLTHHRAM